MDHPAASDVDGVMLVGPTRYCEVVARPEGTVHEGKHEHGARGVQRAGRSNGHTSLLRTDGAVGLILPWNERSLRAA